MSLTSLTGITSSEALGYIKSLGIKVKQMALNLTDLEVKVEEATSNEPWGPHGSVMAEITESAYDSEGYRQIMGVIARRLQDTGEAWRHVYKSLLLLEYMLKHGPQKVVQELTSNVVVVEKLQNFQHKDKNQKDYGENVRHRAKQLADLIMDSDRVRVERTKAKELKSKYVGVSSESVRSKRGNTGSLGSSALGASSRRYVNDDDEDEYEPRSRSSSGGGGGGIAGDKGAIGASSAYDSHDDAAQATRARIDAIRERGGGGDDEEVAASGGRKKLSDVRPDPKVAASLGLKVAAYIPRSKPAPVTLATPDLMGGMESPPRASTDTWNAFETADTATTTTAVAAVPSSSDDLWADFSNERASVSAAAKDPVQELFSLNGGGGNGGAAPALVVSAAADPFGFDAFSEPGESSASAAPVAATIPSGKAALPEDLFSAVAAPPGAQAGHSAQSGYAAQTMQPGQLPYGAAGGMALADKPAFAAFLPYAPPDGYAQPGGAGGGGGNGGAPTFDAEQSLFSSTSQVHVGDLGLTGTGAAAAGVTSSSGPDPFAGLGF